MRKIKVNRIREAVSGLCIEANTNLRGDIHRAIKKALQKETAKPTRRVLEILLENADIAKKEKCAICQDTGIVSVYLEIGQAVSIVGGDLNKAVNDGVKEAYKKAFLRKSVVKSPIVRKNTGTNTPSMIYTDIVKGEKIKITVIPKGFGGENKSVIRMLSPTDGEKEIVAFTLKAVKDAGPDACPPYILGIGIGGSFDKAAALSKKALIASIDRPNKIKYLRKLEKTILREINKLRIGPMGFGARTTCLGVNILEYPTHIAGLPVAVNISCHATRSASRVI